MPRKNPGGHSFFFFGNKMIRSPSVKIISVNSEPIDDLVSNDHASPPHFTATLSVFTAPRVLRAEEPRMVSASACLLTCAVAPLNLRRRAQLLQLEPAEEFPDAQPPPSGRVEPRAVLAGRSDHHQDYERASYQA